MKVSALIREYVDLKIQGEPQDSDGRSVVDCAADSQDYRDKLDELETAIDATLTTQPTE